MRARILPIALHNVWHPLQTINQTKPFSLELLLPGYFVTANERATDAVGLFVLCVQTVTWGETT